MKVESICVVIPTYNEKRNIESVITQVSVQLAKLVDDWNILVVDDESPDGTGGVVTELQKTNKNLHILVGQKEGLGAAYVRGMNHALQRFDPDILIQMDADLSHDPECIPQFVKELNDGADVVLGSRYIDGGGIPEDWGAYRVLNSKLGNFVARWVAGMSQIRDCTTGYRAIRKQVLEKIALEDLGVQGYAFQVAMLHKFLVVGANIVESPIKFIDRANGESKLGFSDVVEFIVNAWWIRLNSLKRFIRFSVVGSSGVLVNLGVFWVLISQGVVDYIASPIAIEVSIINNFYWNNAWTFSDKVGETKLYIRALRFNSTSLLSLGVNFGTFLLVRSAMPDISSVFHQAAGILPAMLFNYFLNLYWTFGNSDSTK